MNEKYYQTSNLIDETDIKAPTLRRYIRELINAGYPDTQRDERGNRLFSELDRRVIIELVRLIQDEKKGVTAAIEEVTANVDEIKAEIEDEKEALKGADPNTIGVLNKEIMELLHRMENEIKQLRGEVRALKEDRQSLPQPPTRQRTLYVNKRNIGVYTDVHKDAKEDITPHVKDVQTNTDNGVVEGSEERTQDVIERNTKDVKDTSTDLNEDITAGVKDRKEVGDEQQTESLGDYNDMVEGPKKKAGIFSRLMNVFK